tara:strand:- start:486 stop:881 length:396 start_codon:yes stop_codon:yes gene_type:complete
MLADVSVLLSTTLMWMSAQAAFLAIVRLFYLPPPDYTARPSVKQPRFWILVAFAIYLTGAVVREGVVVRFGMIGAWSETAIAISACSRSLQVVGATLFVGTVTHRLCGHWVWIGTLVFAFLLGFVYVSVRT